jgi:hypothetical protein
VNHPYINIEMRGRVTRTLFGPVENWHIWRAGPSENQPQATENRMADSKWIRIRTCGH